MSAKERRRRPQSAAQVKIAFGNEDDDKEKQKKAQEKNSILPHQILNKNMDDRSSDKLYERALFTINSVTVEIILENDTLSWSTVTGETSHDETNRRKSTNRDNVNSVNIQNVYAISPMYAHQNWSLGGENLSGTSVSTSNTIISLAVPSSTSTQDSVLRGFQLHSYQTMPNSILQEMLIIFQSNQPNQIEQWYHLLSKIISDCKSRRHILVMLNPYAGPRRARHTYSTKVKAMLERAQHKITYIEIDDQFSADEALVNFEGDFDSIEGLVIIGGDGSVINVINGLIRYLTKENRTRLDIEHDLPSIPFPICIVPDGTTNIICNTIHGNTDHCTPILHLLFNQQMKIDMSAVFDIDYNFATANFSTGAGYPANVLKYFPCYSLNSTKTIIKKSFSKAASNKNLKPMEMKIRYIPVYQDIGSITRCYRGCPTCTPASIEKSDDQVKTFDNFHVQQMNRRKKSSSSASNNDCNNRLTSTGKNSSNQSNEKEKNWKTLENEYLQVVVLTNACLWSFAPQGLSKFGHLANGLLDLILIEPVGRKDFLRYIRRNGNSKNQLELPFTKLIKAKEVEIELKSSLDNNCNELSNTDNQLDSSLSDDSSNGDMSENEKKQSSLKRHEPRPPSAPISEDSRRHRRRRYHRTSEQAPDSSQNMIQSSHYSKNHHKQQEGNGTDNPQIDPYGSTTSLRRSGIFQSLKLKADKLRLPRPSSARGEEPDDERQQKQNRKSTGGTLRPARSLLNLLSSGTFSSGNTDKSSTNLSRDSFSSGIKRRPSVISRSSSVDNPKVSNDHDKHRNKKKTCMWNLDFSPYNSSLIRIKCFYRYLPVYGVGLDPQTKLTEINYSCFGRLGIWTGRVSKEMATINSMSYTYGRRKQLIEQRQKYFQGQIEENIRQFNEHLKQMPSSIDTMKLPQIITDFMHTSQYQLRIDFERRKRILKFDAKDHQLVEAFYRLKPRQTEINATRIIWKAINHEHCIRSEIAAFKQWIS
ncbi:unnamed protein product [Rotaria magnacalcarata]|uniref:DAGKc domain-containing protein n=2 Tax=Rotaria magnacalcarata TaxID=392030 RepID=A0A816NFU4_9BILA|nr:unnamed protein product [Rotaria magnacalcarata]